MNCRNVYKGVNKSCNKQIRYNGRRFKFVQMKKPDLNGVGRAWSGYKFQNK